ncbi:MAG: hypothetical protein H0U67_05350 [Gemmatimonadetes bacterium]|nr:hypothetical protein [Gemmatimonadota bacterium]
MTALIGRQFLHRAAMGALSVAVVGLGTAPGALHAKDCTPVAGSINASLLGGEPTTALGTVTGGLAGATRAIVTSQAAQQDGSVKLVLRHDFVTTDGGVLTTEDVATWHPVPTREGAFLMSTDYTITGGTGRWEGASGTLSNEGVADTESGLLTLRYRGDVCTAEPAR